MSFYNKLLHTGINVNNEILVSQQHDYDDNKLNQNATELLGNAIICDITNKNEIHDDVIQTTPKQDKKREFVKTKTNYSILNSRNDYEILSIDFYDSCEI